MSRLPIALWRLTLLDQHHTRLRVEEVDNSSMGRHTKSRLPIALWGLTLLDQHHTGLRVEEVDNSSMGTHTTGSTSHWVESG